MLDANVSVQELKFFCVGDFHALPFKEQARIMMLFSQEFKNKPIPPGHAVLLSAVQPEKTLQFRIIGPEEIQQIKQDNLIFDVAPGKYGTD